VTKFMGENWVRSETVIVRRDQELVGRLLKKPTKTKKANDNIVDRASAIVEAAWAKSAPVAVLA
jgi:hypothetical protein